jgi:microcin C transport system permease protein
MTAYIIRRLLLVVPTLLAIITINFFIIQIAPGGPVDQMIANLEGAGPGLISRVTGESQGELGNQSQNSTEKDQVGRKYRGARGLDPELIKMVEKQFGFDKPIHIRYFNMLVDYLSFDFGDSLFKGRTVIELVIERLPVSISLGVWSTLISYLVCIPLGIRKAIRHNSRFDIWTSTVIILANAIPIFLFAIILIIFFSSGNYLSWFPLKGLVSNNFEELAWYQQIIDYFWHLALPITCMTIGGLAGSTFLTKNSFLDEINKQYVITARSKGLTENKILYKHVFRNAMLIIIAGFPAAFIGMFFGGSLLIEVIFSLEGIGLLGFEATIQRDYPLMFSSLYIFGLLGLVMGIISDITYTVIDPRIDFEGR